MNDTDKDRLKELYSDILERLKDRPGVLMALRNIFDDCERYRLDSIDIAVISHILLGGVYVELGSDIGEEYFEQAKVIIERVRNQPAKAAPPESVN